MASSVSGRLVILLALAGIVLVAGVLGVLGFDLFGLGARAGGAPSAPAGVGDPDGSAGPTEAAGGGLSGRLEQTLAGPGRLVGRVLDFETRRPLVGARAVIVGVAHDGERVQRGIDTQADGRFRFEGLPAGPAYSLRLTGRGAVPHTATLESIDVRREATRDLGDLLLGRRARLGGHVVDAGGEAVAGANVRLVAPDPSLADFISSFAERMRHALRDAPSVAETRTSAEGAFAFAAIAPGRYTLVVRAPGYARRIAPVVLTPDGVVGRPLVVELHAGAPFRGRIVDARGRPVPDARVTYWTQAEIARGVMYHAYAGVSGDGRFVLAAADRAAERCWILVAAPERPLHVFPASADAPDLGDLVVAEASAVHVRVLGEDGRPLAGAFVMLRGVEGGEEEAEPDGLRLRIDVATTDEQGACRLVACAGDVPALVVTHPSFGTVFVATEAGADPDAAAQPVHAEGLEGGRIRAGVTHVTIRTRARIRLRGRVLDPEGAPIPDAAVSVGFGGYARGRSDEEGRFDLRVFRGDVRVSASKTGYVPLPRDEDWDEAPEGASAITRDVVLQPGPRVRGRVRDAAGRPIAGASVQMMGLPVRELEWHPLYQAPRALTAGDGTYELIDVVVGEGQRVVAEHPAYVSAQVALPGIGPGALVDAPDVVMPAPHTRILRAVDEQGMPAAGVRLWVQALDARGAPIERVSLAWPDERGSDAVTDRTGIARTPPLPRAALRVIGRRSGYAATRATVALDEEAPTLVMRAAHRLEVTVTQPDGRPASTAVWVGPRTRRPDDAEWVEAMTEIPDETDVARFEGLPDAPLRVRVDHPDYRYLARDVRVADGRVALILEALDPAALERIRTIDARLETLQAVIAGDQDAPGYDAAWQRHTVLERERDALRGKPRASR